MSIPELIESMRDMGIEMTPIEVSLAIGACQKAEETVDIMEMGRICLFFAKIGEARDAEGLNIEKFDLMHGVLDFLTEGDDENC